MSCQLKGRGEASKKTYDIIEEKKTPLQLKRIIPVESKDIAYTRSTDDCKTSSIEYYIHHCNPMEMLTASERKGWKYTLSRHCHQFIYYAIFDSYLK